MKSTKDIVLFAVMIGLVVLTCIWFVPINGDYFTRPRILMGIIIGITVTLLIFLKMYLDTFLWKKLYDKIRLMIVDEDIYFMSAAFICNGETCVRGVFVITTENIYLFSYDNNKNICETGKLVIKDVATVEDKGYIVINMRNKKRYEIRIKHKNDVKEILLGDRRKL